MQSGAAEFDDTLSAALTRLGIEAAPGQRESLHAHFQAVLEANQVMNLTRITAPVEAAVKHYADSLAILGWVRDKNIAVRRVLDIGTGAGFPAAPLAIMRADWSLTAIDGTAKKVRFLAATASSLGLTNLHAEQAHSEHWTTGSLFDLVLIRALGHLDRCLQAGARFVAPAGRLVAYKTPSQLQTEQPIAAPIAKRVGLKADEPYPYDLWLGDEKLKRVLAIYRRDRLAKRRGGASARRR